MISCSLSLSLDRSSIFVQAMIKKTSDDKLWTRYK